MTPSEAIEANLRAADRIFRRGGGKAMERILQDSEAELLRALMSAKRRGGGRLRERFTERNMAATREQVRLVTEYAKARLRGLTEAQARKAITAGYRRTLEVLKAFDTHHEGASRQLRLEQAVGRDPVFARSESSMLRSVESSWNRYGKALVEDFEKVLQRAMVTGMTNAETIRALVSRAPADIAERLAASKPRYFPDPQRGFVARQYWAERIVRTETANAYNEANYRSIETAREDMPDVEKKILATFDPRTAPDSMAVHGQIRPLDGYFRDGAGREYLRPPARPNDRETVIPWRSRWSETPRTRKLSEEDLRKEAEAAGKRLRKRQEAKAKTKRRKARKAKKAAAKKS